MKRSTFPLILALLLASTSTLAQTEEPEPSSPAPPAMASPTDPPPPSEESPPRSHRLIKARFFGSLDGGYAYQSLYGTSITGAGFSAVLGGDMGHFDAAAILEASFGTTAFGLHTTTTGVGGLFEGHFDRLRLGGGVRLGTIDVERVTTGGSLFNLSAGIFGRASFDLVRFDDTDHAGAVFLVAKASVDTVGTALYGVSAGLGVRF